MEISKEDIEHVAGLARIELNSQEEESLSKDLKEILNYVSELNGISTVNIEAVGQISALKNIARQDEITNSIQREKLLQNAPETKNGFIKVKQVFENE